MTIQDEPPRQCQHIAYNGFAAADQLAQAPEETGQAEAQVRYAVSHFLATLLQVARIIMAKADIP